MQKQKIWKNWIKKLKTKYSIQTWKKWAKNEKQRIEKIERKKIKKPQTKKKN